MNRTTETGAELFARYLGNDVTPEEYVREVANGRYDLDTMITTDLQELWGDVEDEAYVRHELFRYLSTFDK